ncbi:MAG: hypothetical protein ACYTDW_01565 [Planctomycetota bacterium]|jgi:hypothetical protein
MNQDEEHLKLLSIFHYVVGGIAGLFACIPVFHLIIGIAILVAGLSEASGDERVPSLTFGLMFTLIALIFITAGWTLAICLIVSGRRLARRKHYKFCFVIACISCAFSPFGTVLGIFTIIVLVRPTVKELFGEAAP